MYNFGLSERNRVNIHWYIFFSRVLSIFAEMNHYYDFPFAFKDDEASLKWDLKKTCIT